MATLTIPTQYSSQSSLRYCTLYHPLYNLQKRLTHAAALTERDNMLANPEQYNALEEIFTNIKQADTSVIDMVALEDNLLLNQVHDVMDIYTDSERMNTTSDIHNTSPTQLDPQDATVTPTTPLDHPSTTKLYITSANERQKDLQKTLHSILHSDEGLAIINAPQSNPLYRLDPHNFFLAVC
eukprot:1248204-Ditylum_brightwellii.AAC.1